MHPTDATWRALLDEEVGPLVLRPLEDHLAACEDCRREVMTLRLYKVTVVNLLEVLDGPVPAAKVDAVLDRARRRASRRWALIAAAIGICVVTAAGATMRTGVFHRLVERIRSHPPVPPTVERPKTSGVPDTAAPNGIGFEPKGDLEIAFQEAQGGGQLEIVLGEGASVTIVASTLVRYTVRAGKVVVANAGVSASYLITLPKSIPHAAIRVADRVVFAKTGSAIITAAEKNSTGRYSLPFASKERIY